MSMLSWNEFVLRLGAAVLGGALIVAAGGSVSKRRSLSLSRPSGHHAGRPAGFPDGRRAIVTRPFGGSQPKTRATHLTE